MKFNFLLLLVFGLFLTSCGDDDASCTQADWVGTYVGATECEGEDAEDTSIVIAAGTSENQILIDGEEVTFDGCKATLNFTDPFFGSEINSEYELDGSTLKSTATVSFLGISTECNFEGTK